MSTRTYCDRCGDEGALFRRLEVDGHHVTYLAGDGSARQVNDPGGFDVCGDCWAKLLEWFRV